MRDRDIDERIVEVKRKVTSRGYFIMSFGLMIIIGYRQFYLGQTIGDYYDIFALWLLSGIYVAVSQPLSGLPVFNTRKNSILALFVMATTITLVGVFRRHYSSIPQGIVGFIIAFGAAAAVLFGLQWIYIQWEKKNVN